MINFRSLLKRIIAQMCVRCGIYLCISYLGEKSLVAAPTRTNTHQHAPTRTNTHQHAPTRTNTHQHAPTRTNTHQHALTRTRGSAYRFYQTFTRVDAYKFSFLPCGIRLWNKSTQELVGQLSVERFRQCLLTMPA